MCWGERRESSTEYGQEGQSLCFQNLLSIRHSAGGWSCGIQELPVTSEFLIPLAMNLVAGRRHERPFHSLTSGLGWSDSILIFRWWTHFLVSECRATHYYSLHCPSQIFCHLTFLICSRLALPFSMTGPYSCFPLWVCGRVTPDPLMCDCFLLSDPLGSLVLSNTFSLKMTSYYNSLRLREWQNRWLLQCWLVMSEEPLS